MDNNKRWQLEEEHDETIRFLDKAEEALNDYRQQFYRKTNDLVDKVSSFYRELPYGTSSDVNSRFQQGIEEYNWEIRKKESEIEEARDNERRDFNRKMDSE
ncbi:hypothetical protein ACFO26_05990 [Lactococcus nasutitermitis]|uniref:Uncharacterized protein n=1 Tax=Lactococcus nasutitermitis TaxID=1652957 RepID=A0ABV9JCN7_9LACT|nr:hypothetical protein [Lactococcus nasutitermitis]